MVIDTLKMFFVTVLNLTAAGLDMDKVTVIKRELLRICEPAECLQAFHDQSEPSGVYTLISKGAVTASHQDHPARRLKTADYLKKVFCSLNLLPYVIFALIICLFVHL